MEAWMWVALLLYGGYVVAYVGLHPGGSVTGFRACTLLPFVVPLMVFWWVVGRARVRRTKDQTGISIEIKGD